MCLGACSSPAPLTKAQYLQETDQVCGGATKQLASASDTYVTDHKGFTPGPDTNEQFTRFTVIKQMRDTTTLLSRLSAPDGDQSYVEGMFADYAHALDLWYADPVGRSADAAVGAVATRFASYGMKACAHMVQDASSDVGKRLVAAQKRVAAAAKAAPVSAGETSTAKG